MADLPPYKTPRWVKIAGIIALVLVLLVGIIMVTGIGGEHGPGRHIPRGNTRPSSGQITIALTRLPTEVHQL
jgi:hypothetical protein